MSDNVDIPAPRRGWSSHGLPVIEKNDPLYWSIFDASIALKPELTEEQIVSLIKFIGLQPAGKRYNGSRRRHVRVYLAKDILEAVKKATPLLNS